MQGLFLHDVLQQTKAVAGVLRHNPSLKPFVSFCIVLHFMVSLGLFSTKNLKDPARFFGFLFELFY